jgi:N-acetylglucosamine kinase-like BadF-type ATPase
MVLSVDLGQSGSRIRMGDISINTTRGKLAGEHPLTALRSLFESVEKISSDVASLSCTGFNGIVPDADAYSALCHEFFGATKTAVIDDGLAGFIGALHGRNGVVLSIGGGVVSVGGRDGVFAHRDGLGSTFGDEGSGFWLGKLGITKALAARQGRSVDIEMIAVFKSALAVFDELESKNGSDAATLAISSAQTLLDAADSGVETALAIRNEGAHLLAKTVIATWLGTGGARDEPLEIAIQGGPSGNRNYVKAIQTCIALELPSAKFVSAEGDNLDGAKWIAENMLADAPPLLRWSSGHTR